MERADVEWADMYANKVADVAIPPPSTFSPKLICLFRTFSLLLRCSNLVLGKDFFTKSTIWSYVGTYLTFSVLFATLFFIKCMSVSMCLVLPWCAKETTPLSSHQIIGTFSLFSFAILSTPSKDSIQASSTTVASRDLYLDSVLDLATTICFLKLHEIRLFPK